LCVIAEETYLQRLIWQYLKHSVYSGGNYEDVEHGISLGCPLSPLMAALYLKPLDDLFEDSELFYARFMDDWVIIAPTRWGLRHVVKEVNLLLNSLKLSKAPDKTFIGRVERQFDFLGYHFSPTALTVAQKTLQRRDMRLARLYEQGASDERIEQYVSRWQRWAVAGLDGKVTTPQAPDLQRIKSARYSFEAKLLALGSASLLATTATDSHATIYYADLSNSTLNLVAGTTLDWDCDQTADLGGFTYPACATFFGADGCVGVSAPLVYVQSTGASGHNLWCVSQGIVA
jgi:hypothetical protein